VGDGKWFPRLADVPRVGFVGSPGVDRSRLAGADAVPTVTTYKNLGTTYRSVMWKTSSGESSARPAQQHAQQGAEQSTVDGLLRVTWEALELPGELLDYHFALQSAVTFLWQKHRRNANALAAAEVFARLDLQLLSKHPQEFRIDRDDTGSGFFHVSTFGPLLTILEREGAWRDALAVAEQAVAIGQKTARRDVIAARVAELDAEAE